MKLLASALVEFVIAVVSVGAQTLETINLPAPVFEKSMPLMQAFQAS